MPQEAGDTWKRRTWKKVSEQSNFGHLRVFRETREFLGTGGRLKSRRHAIEVIRKFESAQ